MSKKYILSCVNGYAPSEAVIDYGCWLAKKMNKGLKLFHAIDSQYHESKTDLSGSIGLGAREEMLEEYVKIEREHNKLLQRKSKLILESAKLHALKKGVGDITLCSRKGRVLDNILEFKDDLAIAVIGKYGKRHQGASSGETAVGHKVEGLVKNLYLPVLIVAEDFEEPKSILIAYDGSEGANKVLHFLSEYLGKSGLRVDMVHFGEKNEKNERMLSEAKLKLEQASLEVSTAILPGEADTELPKYLEDRTDDMLAMGAFGHGVIHEFFVGSLTARMIQKVKKPLLLVR